MSTVLHKAETHTKPGGPVQLVTERDKNFIFKLSPGDVYQTHLGEIQHDNLIGIIWDNRVKSHLGKVFFLLKPALDDLIRVIPRETQIVYPKDIGYILVTMGIGPGTKGIEARSGSGGLTTALMPGGFFVCILPTTNQVSLLITALKKREL